MSFSPQLFWSNINAKEGLARPNRFEVILPIPKYVNSFISNSFIETLINLPNTLISDITSIVTPQSTDPQQITDNLSISRYLSLQCESAQLPGRTLDTADVKVYGPTFKVPYQTRFDDGMQFSFLCTNEFYERKLFDRWMECIMPLDTNNLRYPKSDKSRYMTNPKIIQYDEFIQQIYAVELIDAFPIGIASQPLSWGDDVFHRLSVNFAYQKYRVVYQGNYDLVAAATALFGIRFSQYVNQGLTDLSSPLGTLFSRLL